MRSRGPGLAVQGDIIDFLKGHNITTEEASIPVYKRKYLRRNGKNQTLHFNDFLEHALLPINNAFSNKLYHHSSKVNSFEQTKDHVINKFLWK